MKVNPPGREYMGVNPSRRKKPKPLGAFKFNHSKGANSSASRFGTDEPAPSQKRRYKHIVPKPARRTVGMGIMGGKGPLRKGR